ncbi:MAG: hypothetical protein M0026_14570 [Nocardiopsaceae bacterium]|nr:hypothetical protein [Nocardiopsaceae bacterium]
MLIFAILVGALFMLGRLLWDSPGDNLAEQLHEQSSYPPMAEALPMDTESYEQAAALALRHAESYGTFTPGLSEAEYRENIRSAARLADVPEGVALVPAEEAYQLLSEQRLTTRGTAQVTGIDYLGATSIELRVEITAVAEEDGAVPLDLGSHALLMAQEDDEWVVAGTGWESDTTVGH